MPYSIMKSNKGCWFMGLICTNKNKTLVKRN